MRALAPAALQTSVTAATITAARLAPRIQSRSDLVGKTVGTSTFFNGTLPPRVVPVRYSSDGAMLAALLVSSPAVCAEAGAVSTSDSR